MKKIILYTLLLFAPVFLWGQTTTTSFNLRCEDCGNGVDDDGDGFDDCVDLDCFDSIYGNLRTNRTTSRSTGNCGDLPDELKNFIENNKDYLKEQGIKSIPEAEFALLKSYDLNSNEINTLKDLFNNGMFNDEEPINDCERELVLRSPEHASCAAAFYLNSITAFNYERNNFGFNGRNNCGDAFRHAFWNALNSKVCDIAIAQDFGDAHECDSADNSERDMDFNNNQEGILGIIMEQNLVLLLSRFVMLYQMEICLFFLIQEILILI